MTDTHNWQPLIAIADAAGGNWPAAALALAGRAAAEAEGDVSPGVASLRDVLRLFQEEGADRLVTAGLLHVLYANEDMPWREFNREGAPSTFTRRPSDSDLTRRRDITRATFGVIPTLLPRKSGICRRGGYRTREEAAPHCSESSVTAACVSFDTARRIKSARRT